MRGLLLLSLVLNGYTLLAQQTAQEWEERLAGNWVQTGSRFTLAKSRLKTIRTQQWSQVGQRATMGQKCASGKIFTFQVKPARAESIYQVQIRNCVDSAWVTERHSWRVQVTKGKEPELLLDGRPAYQLRIVKKDGSEQLRLSQRGPTPADPTHHYYLTAESED